MLLALALVSFGRFARLRRHIDESASAVDAERRRRDRLVSDLHERRSERVGGEAVAVAGDPTAHPERLTEQVAEAENRLAAVRRLHSAQVRAWNRLGRASLWGWLRGVTGWRPMPEPPPERRRDGSERGQAG